MCTNSVNATQLRATVEQIDEAVALTRRWTHRSYHTAEVAQLSKTAAKLLAAQSLLDEVRALLADASDLVEEEAVAFASSAVTVSIV